MVYTILPKSLSTKSKARRKKGIVRNDALIYYVTTISQLISQKRNVQPQCVSSSYHTMDHAMRRKKNSMSMAIVV